MTPVQNVKQPDVQKLARIIADLEDLQKEAADVGVEEVEILITSSFNICLTIYYMLMRGDYIEKYKIIEREA